MSNQKLIIFTCLSAILGAVVLLSASCSGSTVYKPSGLPERIAYVSERDGAAHIFTIKPDGSELRATSVDNRTTDGPPAWSPDGTKIVFFSNQSSDYEIWTMNANGGDRTKLTNRPGRDSMPRWSPDGSRIVFQGEVRTAEGATDVEIFNINRDGSGLVQLTDNSNGVPVANRISWNGVPTWSPDGNKILFSSGRDGNQVTPILYIMNPDGSGQQRFGLFFEVDGSQPDWSPATGKIVWARGSAAKMDIWVMDGGSPFPLISAKKLTNNIDNNTSPVWSPDGKQIAFVSDSDSNRDIYIMNDDGSNMHRLTLEKANDGYPAWRP